MRASNCFSLCRKISGKRIWLFSVTSGGIKIAEIIDALRDLNGKVFFSNEFRRRRCSVKVSRRRIGANFSIKKKYHNVHFPIQNTSFCVINIHRPLAPFRLRRNIPNTFAAVINSGNDEKSTFYVHHSR
jgi:hypothetical protein